MGPVRFDLGLGVHQPSSAAITSNHHTKFPSNFSKDTGPDGAVAKSLANALIGNGFTWFLMAQLVGIRH